MAVKDNITELGTRPIGSLLLKYATPAVIAMTASSLYHIVDAIFIGQGVGPLAIAGVSLSFPVMQVTAAFGAMVGVGAATLLSVKLGERDYDIAKKILSNVLMLNVIMGVVIGLLMLIFINPILYFFGASDETVSYARDFMTIILLGNVVTHLYLGMNSLLRAAGHPRDAMYATIGTVVINIILAPLFIYVFKWGIQGAAGATVLSQFLVLIWELRLFSNPNELIHFQRGTYRLEPRIVAQTLSIGMSPFLMNLCGCVVAIFFNNRMAFLFAMIVVGLNQGMQPIAGYNYGARKFGRLRLTLIRTITVATGVVCVGYMLCMLFPYACVRAFTTDEQLIERSMYALRIVFFAFPIVGFQMVTTNYFQCVGQVKKSIFLSMTRQLIFIVPLLYILPKFFGLSGVWYTIPASDILSTFLTGYFLYRALKQFKENKS